MFAASVLETNISGTVGESSTETNTPIDGQHRDWVQKVGHGVVVHRMGGEGKVNRIEEPTPRTALCQTHMTDASTYEGRGRTIAGTPGSDKHQSAFIGYVRIALRLTVLFIKRPSLALR